MPAPPPQVGLFLRREKKADIEDDDQPLAQAGYAGEERGVSSLDRPRGGVDHRARNAKHLADAVDDEPHDLPARPGDDDPALRGPSGVGLRPQPPGQIDDRKNMLAEVDDPLDPVRRAPHGRHLERARDLEDHLNVDRVLLTAHAESHARKEFLPGLRGDRSMRPRAAPGGTGGDLGRHAPPAYVMPYSSLTLVRTPS